MLLLNTLKRSLNIELQDFFEYIREQGCSKQAFSSQRRKLSPSFFHDWNQVLVDSFYHHYGEQVKRWHGMRLWAMDGNTVPLPRTEELKREFGCPGNQNGETNLVAGVSVLYDVLNHIVIKGLLHPYFVSEQDVSLLCMENQPPEDVLFLFDRGYPSYWLMYELIQKKSFFVMRVQKNINNSCYASL
jgi:hypothetical protein